MGSIYVKDPKTHFLERYELIEANVRSSFGLVTIFRKKTLNYDYLMLLRQTIDKQLLPTLRSYLLALDNHLHSNLLLRVYLYASTTINDNKTYSYCSYEYPSTYGQIEWCLYYCNYTLKYRMESSVKLNVNEVLYVLHAAIEVAFVYERELFRVLDLDLYPRNIYFTINGCVKFVPIHSRFLRKRYLDGQYCGNCTCYHTLCTKSNQVPMVEPKKSNYMTQVYSLLPEIQRMRGITVNYNRSYLLLQTKQLMETLLLEYLNTRCQKLKYRIASATSLYSLKQLLPSTEYYGINIIKIGKDLYNPSYSDITTQNLQRSATQAGFYYPTNRFNVTLLTKH